MTDDSATLTKDSMTLESGDTVCNGVAVLFQPGDVVSLISDPEVFGAVLSVLHGGPEARAEVLVHGKKQLFYLSQLQAFEEPSNAPEVVSCEHFHAHLTAMQIRNPGLSTLYSLHSARIDFIPHQFRPVLKFIRSDRPRMLIADEVGVGKTIEAGLILRELQARQKVDSVLIICPRPLVTERKWEKEMRRFDERFMHLDGPGLRRCIEEMDMDGEWPEQYKKVIVPTSLMDERLIYGTPRSSKRRGTKGLLDLNPAPRFDLVIVDEAHHIRNPTTSTHQAVRFFCEHADAVVFLTATPLQLGSYELFVLLNVLRPDLVIDPKSFEFMTAPNPHINRAIEFVRAQTPEWMTDALKSLNDATSTPWGMKFLKNNPELQHVQALLEGQEVSTEERVKMISTLEGLHTLSHIINRTRRRDIGEFTIRKPTTVEVPFTPEQKKLHDALLEVQAEIFATLHGPTNVKFMMTTIRRQAASCIFGLAPFVEEILSRHRDELALYEADDAYDELTDDDVECIASQIQHVVKMARELGSEDPKFEALCEVIQNKQDPEKHANNKLIIFSSFRHTLTYLYQKLAHRGFRVGIMHGNTPQEERLVLRETFEMSREEHDAIDIMLFSEIACEGLDYQFCDCIVNYDLPWNPMRIEQRIGRIDRRGQQSESVGVINFVTPGTVDYDIYTRCLRRIGVFERALGGNEEILGEVVRGITSVAEDSSLTDAEVQQRLQQLADNQIRLIQEQERLEKQHQELFGLHLSGEQFGKEVDDATSVWLSPNALNRLIDTYFERLFGKGNTFILGEGAAKKLRLSREARERLLSDYQALADRPTYVAREWTGYLKGSEPRISVTFDATYAEKHRDVMLVMPLHPLVLQASHALSTEKRLFTALQATSKDVPEGAYEFAIYQWQFKGVKPDAILRPVCLSDQLFEHLPELLKRATPALSDTTSDFSTELFDQLDAVHHSLWQNALNTHKQTNLEIVSHKRESLTISHQARMEVLYDRLRKVSEPKIQRMYNSQIETAKADYERRMKALKQDGQRADITFQPVAYGVLYIQS